MFILLWYLFSFSLTELQLPCLFYWLQKNKCLLESLFTFGTLVSSLSNSSVMLLFWCCQILIQRTNVQKNTSNKGSRSKWLFSLKDHCSFEWKKSLASSLIVVCLFCLTISVTWSDLYIHPETFLSLPSISSSCISSPVPPNLPIIRCDFHILC